MQSSALMVMSAVGDLPPVVAAIHADTTHERSGTYEYARKWTPWLEARGVRVVTVSDAAAAARVWHGEMIPARTISDGTVPIYGDEDDEDGEPVIVGRRGIGKRGKLLRTCTQRWKIAPVRRWLRENYPGETFEMWLGISTDEAQRMRRSNVQYITNRYPLIERRMSRNDCARYLAAHGWDVPPKSACVFCPFHDRAAWRELRDAGGEDWSKAVAVDEAIRDKRPGHTLYLHRDYVPLADADMRTPQERGQLDMWTQDECEGVCFL